MKTKRLEELISTFPRVKIAVLGDFFLDKYLDTEPSLGEVSIETGKTAHQVVGVRHSPGAARGEGIAPRWREPRRRRGGAPPNLPGVFLKR